jgi:hypothetical protein
VDVQGAVDRIVDAASFRMRLSRFYSPGIFFLFHAIRLGQAKTIRLRCSHARDRDRTGIYRVEPYVVAADIYSEGKLTGCGGWTWHSGSADRPHRAAIEGILGFPIKSR